MIAEAEAKKHYLPWQYLGNFFADIIEQISVFSVETIRFGGEGVEKINLAK